MEKIEIELSEDFVEELQDKANQHNMDFDTFVDLLLTKGLELFDTEVIEVDDFTYNWIMDQYNRLKGRLFYSDMGEFLREAIREFLCMKRLL